MKDLEARFWVKVDKSAGEAGCWEWVACRNRDGYGVFRFRGRVQKAHRVSYFLTHGEFPVADTDHLCRNRACVNPKHLEAVTHRENTLRGESFSVRNMNKYRCPRGHQLVEGNLREAKSRRGWRECLECSRAASRETHALVRAARMAAGLTNRAYGAQYGWTRAVAVGIILKELTKPTVRTANE